ISAPASEVIQITVKGKQNNITWGTTTVTPPTGDGE
ncbi:TPA: phage tail protein, partial [Morganella morganii]|nr:phage tail protein [Morganella morganii]